MIFFHVVRANQCRWFCKCRMTHLFYGPLLDVFLFYLQEAPDNVCLTKKVSVVFI